MQALRFTYSAISVYEIRVPVAFDGAIVFAAVKFEIVVRMVSVVV